MIQIEPNIISPDLYQKIKNLEEEVDSFREIPLDKIAVEKLREHFRTHHIFHSTGIEGNRLTLQETSLVLKEGIDISDKPLKDSLEVKSLAIAFDFLNELVKDNVQITEHVIKQIHQLLIGSDPSLSPGAYRDIGVIISGSAHRPPEPFEVPILMSELVSWINNNLDENPILLGAIAHHEFVKIHPFKDGNGRTARLLLNLILLQRGFPICNIKRNERPQYYEALSKADTGNYEPIIEVVTDNCEELFAEYIRVRDESNRLKDWAKKIGIKDVQNRLAKEKAEFDLWMNKMNQIKLEFKQACLVLNEEIESYYISYYEYPPITFEKYQSLKERGIAQGTNLFSIRFHDLSDSDRIMATFMFRLHRNRSSFPANFKTIPLELNYFDANEKDFLFIGSFPWSDKITLRSLFFNERGELVVRLRDLNDSRPNWNKDIINPNLQEIVIGFYHQIFENMIGLR